MDFLKVVNIIWSSSGQIFTLGVKGCAARYLLSTSGTVFLLIGNTPTVKYILKKTLGLLEREIKYCTYRKTSARIPIKVQPEKTKQKKSHDSLYPLSAPLLPHVLWGLTMTSLQPTRPQTLNSHESLILSCLHRGQAPPAAAGAPLAQCFPVQEEEECRGRCLLLSTIFSWFHCYSLTTWLSAMIPDSFYLLGEFLDRGLQNQI